MNYTTKSTSVLCIDGITRPLNGPLLRPGKSPVGGWGVTVDFRGQNVPLRGSRPVDIYNSAVLMHTANGEPAPDPHVIWFNLNILWVMNTHPNFCFTTVTDLLAISDINVGQKQDPNVKVAGPALWGSRGWNFLAIWLAGDSYDWGVFLGLVETVLDMLNPATNPTIGCIDCYRNFSIEVGALRESPKHTREEARLWLFNVHNKANARLGKPVLSFDEAKRVNYWF